METQNAFRKGNSKWGRKAMTHNMGEKIRLKKIYIYRLVWWLIIYVARLAMGTQIKHYFLVFLSKFLLDEISTLIGRLSKVDHPPYMGGHYIIYWGPEQNKRQKKVGFALSLMQFELGHLPVLSAVRLRSTPSAPLIPSADLHHQLSWVSSLQITQSETSAALIMWTSFSQHISL